MPRLTNWKQAFHWAMQ